MKFVVSYRAHLAAATALVALFPLTACRSHGNTTSPSSSTAGTSSAPSGTTPAPDEKTTVTLLGKVTDAPIAGAQVVVTVGVTTAQTTADANGLYSLSLTVANADKALPVVITATGVEAQAAVKFLSLPGTFATLVANAGPDAVLTDAENLRVNVTNVSTAEAALLLQLNGGRMPTTQSQQDALAKKISVDSEILLAGALKLLVDQPAKYKLPSGTADTLAFAQNASVRNDHIKALQRDSASNSALAQAADDTVANPDMSRALTAAGVPATLITLDGANNDARFISATFCGLQTYTFSQTGLGTLTTCDGSSTTTWHLDGRQIVVVPDHPDTFATTVYNASGDLATQTPQQFALSFQSERLVAQTVTAKQQDLDDDASAPSQVTVVSNFYGLRPEQDFTTFLPAGFATQGGMAMTGTALNDGNTNIGPYDADIVTFQAGGRGTTLQHAQTFTWAVDATGGIKLTYADGGVLTLHGLGVGFPNQDVNTQYLYGDVVANGTHITALVPFVQSPNALAFTETNSLGTFYYQGVGNQEQGLAAYDARLKGGFEDFLADHTGCVGFDFINPDATATSNSPVVTPTQSTSPSCYFRWSLPNGGTRQFQRNYDDDRSKKITSANRYRCDPTTSTTCLPWERRVAYPFGQTGQRYYWLEFRETTNDPRTPLTSPDAFIARFNRIYHYDVVADSKSTGSQTATASASDEATPKSLAAPQNRRPGRSRRLEPDA